MAILTKGMLRLGGSVGACRTLCLTWMDERGGREHWSSQAWLSWSKQEILGMGDTLQEELMFAQKHGVQPSLCRLIHSKSLRDRN